MRGYIVLLALGAGIGWALLGPKAWLVRVVLMMGSMGLVMGLLDRSASGRVYLADVLRRVGEGVALASLIALMVAVDRTFLAAPPHSELVGLVWPLVEGWPRRGEPL